MSDNGNEPAFARPESGFTDGSTGLTKREWFAGMAMQGLLADASRVTCEPESEADKSAIFSGLAEYSLRAADALLAELAKAESEVAR